MLFLAGKSSILTGITTSICLCILVTDLLKLCLIRLHRKHNYLPLCTSSMCEVDKKIQKSSLGGGSNTGLHGQTKNGQIRSKRVKPIPVLHKM